MPETTEDAVDRSALQRRGAVRLMLLAGACAGGSAVAAGAFGAHALRAIVTPDRLLVFETAVRYQLAHALALVLAGIAAAIWPQRAFVWAAALFAAGIVLFSGSLYVLVASGVRAFGAVTPAGGVALIGGWIAFAWGAWHAAPLALGASAAPQAGAGRNRASSTE